MKCQLIIEIKTEVGRRMRRIKWRHSPTNPQRYYQYFYMSVCLDSRWCDGRWYGKKYLLWCLWVYINLLRWFPFQRRVMAWFIRRGNKKENVVRDKKENLFRELWWKIMIGEVCGVGCAMKARRSLRFMMIDFVILALFNYFFELLCWRHFSVAPHCWRQLTRQTFRNQVEQVYSVTRKLSAVL